MIKNPTIEIGPKSGFRVFVLLFACCLSHKNALFRYGVVRKGAWGRPNRNAPLSPPPSGLNTTKNTRKIREIQIPDQLRFICFYNMFINILVNGLDLDRFCAPEHICEF